MKNLFITLFLTVFTTNFISAQIFITKNSDAQNELIINSNQNFEIDVFDTVNIYKKGANFSINFIKLLINDIDDAEFVNSDSNNIYFQFEEINQYKLKIGYIYNGQPYLIYITLDIDYTTLSINEQLPSITDFKLYPNPVGDVLNLEFNAENSNDIQIYNIAGQLIETINSSNGFNKITYNTAHLAKGFYIIKIGAYQSSFVR